MKKLITILIFCIASIGLIFAQAPATFKYQAVVRDNVGNIISSQNVKFRINLLKGNPGGSSSYSEIHITATNQFGITNLEIGNGSSQIGSIDTINWGKAEYFLKIELDPTGSSGYTDMGTAQLLSVPYALYAEKSGSTDNESQSLSLNGNNLSISGGNTVTLFDNINGMKRFTTSDTWTCPSGITKIRVIAIGAGGGGGGGNNGGGGGGSGAYVEDVINVVPGQNYQIFIGSGGAGGVSVYAQNDGVDGGATSFDNLVIANGGAHGGDQTIGTGGTATSLNGFSINGNNGSFSAGNLGGLGGNTPMPFFSNSNGGIRGAAGGGSCGGSGGNGGIYGGGGGGTGVGSGSNCSSYGGGSGANGLLIIYW